jgi:hypothetical protein
MPAHIRKNSNSNLKIPGANVDTRSLGVLMYMNCWLDVWTTRRLDEKNGQLDVKTSGRLDG